LFVNVKTTAQEQIEGPVIVLPGGVIAVGLRFLLTRSESRPHLLLDAVHSVWRHERQEGCTSARGG
jgi:hypothetical protein